MIFELTNHGQEDFCDYCNETFWVMQIVKKHMWPKDLQSLWSQEISETQARSLLKKSSERSQKAFLWIA